MSVHASRALNRRMLIKAPHISTETAQSVLSKAVELEDIQDFAFRYAAGAEWIHGVSTPESLGEGWFECAADFDHPTLDDCDWDARLMLERTGPKSSEVVAVEVVVGRSSHRHACRQFAACIQSAWLGRPGPAQTWLFAETVAVIQPGRPYADSGTSIGERIQHHQRELEHDNNTIREVRTEQERVSERIRELGHTVDQLLPRVRPLLTKLHIDSPDDPRLHALVWDQSIPQDVVWAATAYLENARTLRTFAAYRKHDEATVAFLATLPERPSPAPH